MRSIYTALLLLTATLPVGCVSTAMRNPALAARVSEIKGLNLGNALDAPTEGAWGVTLTNKDFALVEQAGFNAVRIPIRWSAHAQTNAPYRIDTAFLARVDWAVEQAAQHHLLALINVHHYVELNDHPDEQEERYLALWRQISEHYADYNESQLWFELLNEPNNKLQGARWNALMTNALAVVRNSNGIRPVVIGGDYWNAYNRLAELPLPEDHNLVLTFHYYQPFFFTHQGASWVSGMDQHLGTTWEGTDAQRAEIEAHFAEAAAVQKATGLPILVGEFGTYSKAPMDSRVRWTAEVARSAERHGFGWTYWNFRSGFGIYDSEAHQWRTGLFQALMARDPAE